jgi:UPF0716 protein FxsA
MSMVLVLLFVVWPLAELFVIVEVAQTIGVLYTLILLLAGVPAGSWALRSQGSIVWRRAADAVAAGRPPGRHLLDGALVVAGGALLIVPGFITDVLGIVLLLPPTRALIRTVVMRNLQSRLVLRTARFGRRSAGPYDVDSTATDVEQRRLQP